MAENTLYFGDNLDILRHYIADESIDLIYLDPPFNSNQAYNVIFSEEDGAGSGAQIEAFDDTWHWTMETARHYAHCVEQGGRVGDTLEAFRRMLGETDMMAYLANMAPRLVELRRVLKPTGSIYLHCDPTASHYLKVLMDGVFGVESFRNEIVWQRTPFKGSSKARARQLPRSHDTILFYSNGEEWCWKSPAEPYTDAYLKRFRHEDARGMYRKTLLKTYSDETLERLRREDRLIEPTQPGANYSYKQYLHESPGSSQLPDMWTDINMLNPNAAERLGYPTQKPEALLERIIEASSNEGDLVLDPFCGCGTTIAVAHRLKRRWIGIDITHLAVGLMKYRLQNTFGPEVREEYEVIGEPTDVGGAQALALEDRMQFEFWALGLVGVPPAGQTGRGSDKGVDGRINVVDNAGDVHRIIVSVKSGTVHSSHISEIRGVVEREKAAVGVLVTLNEPTAPMRKEAAAAGFWSPSDDRVRASGEQICVPRIQILTIEELLHGAAIDFPYREYGDRGFKRAPRSERPQARTERLGLEE